MGEVCLIPEGLKCCLGQRQVLLRPRSDVSGEYIFWALQSPYVQHQISWNEGTGTTVSNVRIPVLKALQIPRHPDNEDDVAKVLSSLARRIELNKQTNQTLEQMAQALFKSWFVDFDPVVDNALATGNSIPDELAHRVEVRKKAHASPDLTPLPEHIRNLFPSEFEQTGEPTVGIDGWVPKGWLVDSISSFCEILNGFAFKSSDYVDDGHFVLRTKNFNEGEVSRYSDDVFLSDEFLETHEKYLAKPFDYHLVMVGASVGKCALIYEHQLPALRNQNMWCFRSKDNDRVSQSFVKYMLDDSVKHSIGLASGSAREFFRKGDFGGQLICVGNPSIQSAFNKIVLPYLQRRAAISKENATLTKLRDFLLPKLISGEIQLDSASISEINQEADVQGV